MIDADTVIARLREADARSGGRRLAWTETWANERARLDAIAEDASDAVMVERDAFAHSHAGELQLPAAAESIHGRRHDSPSNHRE